MSDFVSWVPERWESFKLFVLGKFRCRLCLNITKRKGNPDRIRLNYYEGNHYKPKVATLRICSECSDGLEKWKKVRESDEKEDYSDIRPGA